MKEKISKCYVCKKCGMTHYKQKMKKCTKCDRKLNKKETKIIFVEC